MIDMVFDIQRAYRKVVHAFAYPGEVVSLKEEADQVELPLSCRKGTAVLMLMLLDADTTFHVVEDREELHNALARITYCQGTTLADAAHVVVPIAHREKLPVVMSMVQRGTLEDPHLGATLLVECSSLMAEKELYMKGPGIRNINGLAGVLKDEDIRQRERMLDEFPLGFDMLLIDEEANCVAIPRTIQIERG